MIFASGTDIGLKRKVNEDSWLIKDNGHHIIFAVADGMGGHNAGDVASQMAINTIMIAFSETSADTDYKSFLKTALQLANSKIYEESIIDVEKMGMGTTIVVAIINKITKEVIVANIGDSRVYFLNREKIKLITEDDSIVAELLKKNEITAEEAEKSPIRNIITNSLGANKSFKVEMINFKFAFGSMLLLCSDGLTDLVSEKMIYEIALMNLSAKERIDKMIQEALLAGGVDNITIILIDNRS